MGDGLDVAVDVFLELQKQLRIIGVRIVGNVALTLQEADCGHVEMLTVALLGQSTSFGNVINEAVVRVGSLAELCQSGGALPAWEGADDGVGA